MRSRAGLLTGTIIGALVAPPAAMAQAAGAKVATHFSVDRRYTSNALDAPAAVPDWLTAMRGGVSALLPHESGAVRLGLEAGQTMHDRVSIEDDSSLRLSLGIDHAASERLSLAAEAAFSAASEGDDIDLGDTVIGIRTRTLAGSAGLKAGWRLGESGSLAGELAVSRKAPGLAAFEAGLAEPQQLSPRRDTFGGALRLARERGTATYAAAAGGEVIQVGVPGAPPYDFRLARQFARAEAATKFGRGFSLAAALGAERLTAIGGDFDVVRPGIGLSLAYALAGGGELRGALSAGLDLTGGDDPLGSWLRTADIGAALPLGKRFTLTGGASAGLRENFLLGYEEVAWAAHAGGRVALGHGLTLAADLGFSTRRPLVDGAAPIAAFDAGLTLSAALPVATAR